MSLLKIAARVAENLVLKDKAIELSTPFTENDSLSGKETELERENLPIVSESLKALIDPGDDETFGGIPSYHTIQIDNLDYEYESADPSVGIMSESGWVESFDVVGIDGYAVNAEDAAKLKDKIELTDKEQEELVEAHKEANEPDYNPDDYGF